MLNGVAFKEGRCFCPRYTSLLSRNVQLLRVSSALAGDPRLSYRVNTSYLARTFPTKRVSRVINFTGSLIGRSCILARPNPLPTTNEIKVTRRQLIVISPLCILSFFARWSRKCRKTWGYTSIVFNGALYETLAGKFESDFNGFNDRKMAVISFNAQFERWILMLIRPNNSSSSFVSYKEDVMKKKRKN